MFEAKTNLKTAIFFADGCEEIEGLTVVDLLYRAGIPCTKVSITQSTEVTSSHEVTFRTDTTIGELDFDQYDMIILPGGIPGTPNPDCSAESAQPAIPPKMKCSKKAALCSVRIKSSSATTSSQAAAWVRQSPSVSPSSPTISEKIKPAPSEKTSFIIDPETALRAYTGHQKGA